MTRTRTVGASAGLLGSLVVHALGYLVMSWVGSAPDIGLELQLPDEIEFGVAEVAQPTPAPAPAPEAAPAPEPPTALPPEAPPAPEPEEEREAADAGVDAGIDSGVDAGNPSDAGLEPTDAGPSRTDEGLGIADAGALVPSDAGSDGGLDQADAGRPLLAAYAPQGAQLALRLHLGRIRASRLAPDVQALLEVVPDWQALVDGSGIDALVDLERLYLASPNLKRSSLVVAGQYVGDTGLPRRAVANLAKARGVTATWTQHAGIDVAPWENSDPTKRIVALIGPRLFTISRAEDLPRILQVAATLARRLEAADAGTVDPGEALLALRDGETIALSVEGARAFVASARPAQQGVPERLEVTITERRDGGVHVLARGLYDDEAQALEATSLWRRTRDRIASHPLVSFIGMRSPLVGAELATEGRWLHARGTLTEQQARVLIGFVRNALAPPPTAPPPQTAQPPAPPVR